MTISRRPGATIRSLEKTITNSFPVFYGLAEIAYRQHDTNAAIQYYERYLTNIPPLLQGAAEVKSVQARLSELRP